MKIQIILGLLLWMSVNYGYGQDSRLSLNITRIYEGMEWCPRGVDWKGNSTPVTDENQFKKDVGNTNVPRSRPPITDKDLVLRCELTNISEENISIDFFVLMNSTQVESPDGAISNYLGFGCNEGGQSTVFLAPQATLCWNFDNRLWYSFADNKRESGTYKFYWTVNGIKSEPFVYEYVREKE